jgi:8-oxo-dGTP pyrophosphatase MutT (NUDIX family)
MLHTHFCTNCGEHGHSTKQCLQPITSYGIILFRVKGGWNQAEQLITSDTSLNGLECVPQANLEYLLIQRKDSLGFIDILRAKYNVTDIAYISQQLRGMTRSEQEKLLFEPFDSLWEQMWGPSPQGTNSYKNEKEQSRQKLEALRAGTPSLEEIIKTVNHTWDTPEWGFPKGRRDPHETEYFCALRELWEETGISERDVIPIKNLEPISETFFGSNHIQYSHKYYIMYMPQEREVVFDSTNKIMSREIGDIRWCSLEEGSKLIRADNIEKREMLFRVARLLRNYCPFQNGAVSNIQLYGRQRGKFA